MPRFSVIVVHYQGTIPREIYLRGLNSVLNQTFKDFEVLVYHDGPLLDAEAPTPAPIRCTRKRFNDWGHSLRDLGIREASGEYIVHFNADNILYPNALEEIAKTIGRPALVFNEKGQPVDNAALIIFPIIQHDHVLFLDTLLRLQANSGVHMIMTGNPPYYGWIDCMQLVMKREIWLAEGGWYDKSKIGDGKMYEKFARKYGYRGVGPVLGEHF